MQNTSFESPAGLFTLLRPGSGSLKSLQAWDAADEYLIENSLLELPNKPVAVFNDQFGALGVCLNKQVKAWVSDSYCAHQALKSNVTQNSLSINFPVLNPLQSWNESQQIENALIKLPKNLSYLTQILEQCVKNNVHNIYIAGMMKHLPKHILDFLKKFGEVDRAPFKKKATIYKLRINKVFESHYPKHLTISDLKLVTHANVFGRDKLDPGAAFVIENIHKLPKVKTAADLCCGSGILGIQYVKFHPECHMSFFDESFMAIQSTTDSCDLNHIPHKIALWGDGLKGSNDKFDLIICNPPFHEEHTVGDHIARRLFADAQNSLSENGQIVVIGNRHLGYHRLLQKYFKHVSTLASNSKFILMRANG